MVAGVVMVVVVALLAVHYEGGRRSGAGAHVPVLNSQSQVSLSMHPLCVLREEVRDKP